MVSPAIFTGQPPYSQEAEEAVLGAVLVNPDAFLAVASFLKDEDFYILRNQYIWEAMARIGERNDPIDYLTVQDELRAMERLNDIGGPAYITQLINSVPTSVHAEIYGRLVERAAIRRRMLLAADEIKALAMDEELAIEQVTNEAESRLFRVTERNVRRDIVPLRQALGDYFERIEHLMQFPNETIGLPTGFRDVDTLLGGLQKSDLLIFAGRPGMGKTSFLLSVTSQAAKYDARIAIFSMEMGADQIVQRLISMETGINSQRLRLGQLNQQEWNRFVQATGRMSNLRIFIDDSPALTPLQLRTKCRRIAHEHGLDLIIVDYLQLMNSGGNYENNRVQEISYISRGLKELARELNVPLFTAAQLSRAVEQRQDKRPQLSDLRESGCLAGDSLVYLPDSGQQVPIRDLVGKPDVRILALNTDTLKLETAPTSNAFCTGVKPVYRLTTRLGRTVRATANHKFLTICGWKQLDELTTEDCIAVPRALPSSQTQTMSDAELALLAHLIGDGCTLPKHAIQYTTREIDLAETVSILSTAVFGSAITPRICREPGKNWYQVFLSSTEHLTHNKRSPVRSWMDGLGVFGLRSYEKYVPCRVFEQPPQAIACFLRHIWSTDGHVGLKKTVVERYPAVFYATSSKRLAQDIQHLLLRLNINACVARVSQGERGRDQYHVQISGSGDLTTFIDEIGALPGRRSEQIEAIRDYLISHPANTNRDIIPSQIWRMYAVPSMQLNGVTSRKMQEELGNQYCGTGLYKQNVSRVRAARLGSIVKSDAITSLAHSDIYWDAIVSIQPDGETDVYDLTVPIHSNFTVNNIIAHNSIEQDADIVMFLYRDAVYNDATEFPNAAEVIVAKHRNGPTGKVMLHFDGALTKFSDAKTQSIDLSAL
ncbi:MAG: replicative DNA helicase [Chloroflexota bacterium]|nr:replicative DNA helicase [Chloroflexota bacterium]